MFQHTIVFFSGIHGAKMVVFLENLEAMLGEYGLISNFEGSGSLGEKPMVTLTDMKPISTAAAWCDSRPRDNITAKTTCALMVRS